MKKVKRSEAKMLMARVTPELKRRIRIQVARLGDGWTVGRFVIEAMELRLAELSGRAKPIEGNDSTQATA